MIFTVMVELQQWQLAYLAGLVDGEGSLECQREIQKRGATPRFVFRLAFCFATIEPLATISIWLGIPVKTYPATDPSRSPRHQMHITKNIAVPMLREMLPFLILKKRQAEIVLAIENIRASNSPSRKISFGENRRMPESAIDEMTALWIQLRSLKSNKRRMDARVNQIAA